MKKSLCILLVAFSILMTGCSDSSGTKIPSEDSAKQEHNIIVNSSQNAYTNIIEDYKNILEARFDEDYWVKYENGEEIQVSSQLQKTINQLAEEDGVWGYMLGEMGVLLGEDAKASDFGYILVDINSDGTEELFWVDKNYNIYAIFTSVNDEPVLLGAYWPRYHVSLTNSGEIHVRGSSGAAYTTYKRRVLEKDADKLVTIFEAGTDGTTEDLDTIYYEVQDEMKNTITEKAFHKLMKEIREESEELLTGKTITYFED